MPAEKARNKNMTEGAIGKQLILFALPLLAGSLIQQLYNTVDLIFVGQLLGKEAAAAVGASSLLITCMVGFFTGMSVGSGIVAAKCFGVGNYRELGRIIHTGVAIGVFGGALLMAVGYIFAPVFLRWLNTPEDIFIQATGYIRIYFLSLIPLVGYNIGAGILRALGDSKSPMIYQLVGGLTNVAANALFICLLGWGVKGSALASLIAQGLAAALVFFHLSRLDEAYRLRPRQIRIDRTAGGQILAVGIPAGIQAMVITLSNLIVQYNINSLGVDSIAAFTAYFKVELFIYLPIMAYGQAATIFTGQNFGAGKLERVKRGTRVSLWAGIITTVVLSGLVLIFARQAFALFSNDAGVIELGRKLAFTTFPFYFIYLVMEVLAASIRGTGKALPPMLIILTNICILRIALLSIMTVIAPGIRGIAIVYPITWASTALCMFVYYRRMPKEV
ncbi:putative efflux protein, MATE family [Desulfosporosinus youngiae DSM 17734]|uniref:Probable multidrug resistance protein NorM n=2 Tax=Desulfosporosinus TaxID=79206 RepID=H5Y4M3_9FIRM|nr:putative efflux protein, MATE family [Desulfosporosinus youngiae DSM 17734]